MDDIHSPDLRRLLADWERRRNGREFPARRDFEPWDIKYILGYLNIVDALYDPLRFRYRIFGSDLAFRLGIEMTGRFVHDYPVLEHREMVTRRYVDVVAERRPIAALHDRRGQHHRLYSYESLVLPLSSDGTTIDTLMAGFAFDRTE
jgi:hypothetical protein